MKILEVQNLSKIYGKEENQINALKNVSFGMEKGEFAAVVGESGSGKSTLLNCIGGLDTPTAGRVFVDGEEHGQSNSSLPQCFSCRRKPSHICPAR